MTRRPLLAVLALPILFALAACGGGGGSDDPIPVAEPVEDDPIPVAEEVFDFPDDAVLGVFAVLTADNGATMQLRMVVHKSLAWDDPAGAELAALMTSACSGAMDDSVYEARLTSFTLIDVTATVTSGDWPDGAGAWLVPAADYTSVARSGDVIDDPAADPEAPHCSVDKQIAGPGSGTIVVGLAGDTDAMGAAGGFTKWANHNYGYAVLTEGTFTACLYEVTPLGEEFGWDDPFETVELSDICKFGNFAEDDDR